MRDPRSYNNRPISSTILPIRNKSLNEKKVDRNSSNFETSCLIDSERKKKRDGETEHNKDEIPKRKNLVVLALIGKKVVVSLRLFDIFERNMVLIFL